MIRLHQWASSFLGQIWEALGWLTKPYHSLVTSPSSLQKIDGGVRTSFVSSAGKGVKDLRNHIYIYIYIRIYIYIYLYILP